jgi:hypothetical protein
VEVTRCFAGQPEVGAREVLEVRRRMRRTRVTREVDVGVGVEVCFASVGVEMREAVMGVVFAMAGCVAGRRCVLVRHVPTGWWKGRGWAGEVSE